jgi:hypothetical protein
MPDKYHSESSCHSCHSYEAMYFPEQGNEPEETVKEALLSEGVSAKEAIPATKYTGPAATGNEIISVLKHCLVKKSGGPDGGEQTGVELSLQNNSDKTVGTAVFEAVFYDRDGNVVDTGKREIYELSPGPRAVPVFITSSSHEGDKVAGYIARVVKATIPPTPNITGTDKVIILKHSLLEMQLQIDNYVVGVEFSMKNSSDITIATMMFEAEFFDKDGNIFEKVMHSELEFHPGQARGVRICASTKDYNKVKSYSVKIVKLMTTDVEKVHICRREIKLNEAGGLDITGSVKNISGVKTDAAIVVSYLNRKNEDIGSRVIVIAAIEPDSYREFKLDFKPPEGDIVNTGTLKVVSDVLIL